MKVLIFFLLFNITWNAHSISSTLLERALAYSTFLNASSIVTTDFGQALTMFTISYDLHPTTAAAENIIWMLDLMARREESDKAVLRYIAPLEGYNQSQTLLLKGIEETKSSNDIAALSYYMNALKYCPHRPEIWFQIGCVFSHFGNVEKSRIAYENAINIVPSHIKSLINLATLHHRSGNFDIAMTGYLRVMAVTKAMRSSLSNYDFLPLDYIKAMGNIVMLHYQTQRYQSALDMIEDATAELNKFKAQLPNSLLVPFVDNELAIYAGYRLLVQRTCLIWTQREELVTFLTEKTLNRTILGPLLPFDTLLLEVSLRDRYHIAVQAAERILPQPHSYAISTIPSSTSRLRIGVVTADIANHPTAHLLEGLLSLLLLSTALNNDLELWIFSYGPPNNSSYRTSISSLSHHFVDLHGFSSRQQFAEEIYAQSLEILLDMQVFTLGGQLEVIAARPPGVTTINYLVCPGTSGARFMDFIVGDHVVIPPEHSVWYSERLLLMPPTYQPSFYGVSAREHLAHAYSWQRKARLRHENNLPLNGIVLCSFNKVDKIDPVSFNLWMQIMQQHPTSVLWILGPTSSNEKENPGMDNLRALMGGNGVHPSRLILAQWMDKQQHIERHLAADLFLDTIIYGAHSTATDAVHGGVPVLTFRGETFSSRVATSLWTGLFVENRVPWHRLFVVDSLKDYVSTAHDILTECNRWIPRLQTELLHSLRDDHVTTEPGAPRRDHRHARHFLRAMQASHEIDTITFRKPNEFMGIQVVRNSALLEGLRGKRFHLVVGRAAKEEGEGRIR